MTRFTSGDRVKFGVAEWIGLGTLILMLGGGWVDMRVQHAVAVKEISALKDQNTKILDDHEARIRTLERENGGSRVTARGLQ